MSTFLADYVSESDGEVPPSPEIQVVRETRDIRERRIRPARRANVSDPERQFRPANPQEQSPNGDWWTAIAKNLAANIMEQAGVAGIAGKKKSKKRHSYEMESGYTSDEEDEKLVIRSSKDYKDWEDDGEKIISAKMRMLFTRKPNSDPEDWWSKSFSAPVLPVLTDTVYYDHLLINRVNKDTIGAAHDGRNNPEIKAWSPDNSGYGRQMTKMYKLIGNEKNGVQLKSGAELKELATIWVIVDSLWSQVMVFHQVRGHDYGPLVVMWCLHQVRFFNGPAKGDVGKQRILVESYVNSMTNENNARQRRGKAPMGAEEAMKEARRLCTTSMLDPSLLSRGDVYGESTKSGGRQGYQSGNNQSGNNQRGNNQSGNNQRGNNHQGNRGQQSTRDKINSCCRLYNEGKECTFGARCTRKHQCSWLDRDTGRVCWEHHPKANHQAIKAANNQQQAPQAPAE